MQAKNRNVFFLLLKIIVFAGSGWYIFQHVRSRASVLEDASRLSECLQSREAQEWLLLCLMGMILNWSLEVVKWKKLVTPIEPITFFNATKSVLTGVTSSFFTPNRVGEFAGRIVHLDEGYRIRGVLAAFVGSSAQLLVTLQLGLLAVTFSLSQFYPDAVSLYWILRIVMLFSIISLFFLWIKIPKLSLFFERVQWLKKYREYGSVFSLYAHKELVFVYALSLLRYLVFCSQQYLLFKAFQVDMDYLVCLKLTAISFLVLTVIPSIAFGELGIRGGVNLALFGTVTGDTPAILLVTFALWMINLAIPALMGAMAILYIRIRK